MWCFHDRLREFTFKDGTTIKMCPDCTAFDSQRRANLKIGNVELPKAKEQQHWGLILDAAGLTAHEGLWPWLTYTGDASGALKALFMERTQKKTPTPVDDHEHIERAKPFPHTLSMPRKFNAYCVHCIEVILSNKKPWVVRMTKGIYLPIEHECNSVRVYNLQGTLLEVKVQ